MSNKQEKDKLKNVQICEPTILIVFSFLMISLLLSSIDANSSFDKTSQGMFE